MKERHELAFLDLEASAEERKILDIGALREDETVYHGGSVAALSCFLKGVDTLCGHNLSHYDLPLLREAAGVRWNGRVIDTLYLSPLLFPKKPYHALLKDDKLQVEELNNPVNDCRKARDLYLDEVSAFQTLPKEIREVYAGLLKDQPEFRDFWTEMHMYGETEDLRMEPAPEEILLQLGHRDVVLSFFRSRTAAVGKLRAGIPLRREGEYLTAEMDGKAMRVAKMSRACLERIRGLEKKGYVFAEGWIRYIVAWKAEENLEECWVILPNLTGKRT